MGDHLTRHRTGFAEVQAVRDVIETTLDERQHVLTGDALHVGRHVVVLAELGFKDAVCAADLLLFTQLQTVLGLLLSALTVHSRRGMAKGHRALFGVALVALQKQLGAFSAALSANRTCISCHDLSSLRLFCASADGSRCAGSASRP